MLKDVMENQFVLLSDKCGARQGRVAFLQQKFAETMRNTDALGGTSTEPMSSASKAYPHPVRDWTR